MSRSRGEADSGVAGHRLAIDRVGDQQIGGLGEPVSGSGRGGEEDSGDRPAFSSENCKRGQAEGILSRILATGGLRPILKLPLQNQKDSDFAGVISEFLCIRNSYSVRFVAVDPGFPILTDGLNSLRCNKILASR